MAEGIARSVLAGGAGGAEQVNVFSAGVMAGEGSGATPESVRAVAAMGVDISAHRSVRLTPAMIAGADMIFGLTDSHVRAIVSMDPGAAAKVFTLDPGGGDIPDPIGQSQGVYDQTAAAIRDAIEQRAGLIAGRR